MSVTPTLSVQRVALAEVSEMREAYRREMACQIVHDSWHRRGFSTLFELRADDTLVGYAAVAGAPGEPHNVLKELYLVPRQRELARAYAMHVVEASGAQFLEAQTNDLQLSLLLWDCGTAFSSETMLFADDCDRDVVAADVTLRPVVKAEHHAIFTHHLEPIGDWGLEHEGTVVATGGFFTHYNPPFVDLYLEVAQPYRGRGYGTLLVQELRRLARLAGYRPAARCSAENMGSRLALVRGGLRPCGRIVRGRLQSVGTW